MRVVKIPTPNAKTRPRNGVRFAILGILVPLALLMNVLRPLPDATFDLYGVTPTQSRAGDLAWPGGSTQAAIGAEGFGLLDTSGTQTPIATASIAKVITALCVLQKHPLKKGEQGPKIRITEADYLLYHAQVSGNGSNLPVFIGEELTEYQALQALMIPSANNIADTLAIWSFGTMEAYHAYANNFVKNIGMSNTILTGDASGYDSGTKSTAQDLVRLGLTALRQPVLMEIAGQKEANFPLAGTLQNYNKTLGQEGITGLKTGNNLENLGGLLFTQTREVEGKPVRFVGAVLGASTLTEALDMSVQLAQSTPDVLTSHRTGQKIIGTAKTAWGATATLRERERKSFTYYSKEPMVRTASLTPNNAQTKHAVVGKLVYKAGTVETATTVEVAEPAKPPSIWWRLTRGF